MGITFRKSINLGGGFRINLSKSGVGYSWGVPGYRITKTATGKVKTTLSIPGTGLRYVEESKIKSTQQINNKLNTDSFTNIDCAPIEHFQNIEYSELIKAITQIMQSNTLNNNIMIGLICCLVITLLLGQSIIPIIFFIALILKFSLHSKTKIELKYTVDNDIMNNYKKKMTNLLALNNCSRKWQVIQYAHVSDSQRKYNAGAVANLNRISFSLTNEIPSFLSANIDIVQVVLGKEKLIFLPDKILIFKDSNVGVINYNSLSIDFSTTNFIEDGIVPNDTEIIDYTWKYVNKNGSPDRRFNNNRQLPICLYYDIYLTSKEGLNIRIQCSNQMIAQEFVEIMKI